MQINVLKSCKSPVEINKTCNTAQTAAILRLTHVQSCAILILGADQKDRGLWGQGWVEPSTVRVFQSLCTKIEFRMAAVCARRACRILPQVFNLSSERTVLSSSNFESKRFLHLTRRLLGGNLILIAIYHFIVILWYCVKSLAARGAWHDK